MCERDYKSRINPPYIANFAPMSCILEADATLAHALASSFSWHHLIKASCAPAFRCRDRPRSGLLRV
jgi:hypothetical protein